MWIVRLALRRPYTFVVMSLLILILGPLAILNTPTDIFPNIDIPVISVVYSYTGLSAEEIADRIVVGFERGLTTTVNDIEHIESQSLNGLGVIKIYFHPNVRIDMAMAQVTALGADPPSEAILRDRIRRLSSSTTPPRCPFFSWRCPERISPSSNCTTSGQTSSGCNWRPCRELSCPIPTGESSARFRWTWISRRSRRKESPRTMW